MEGQTLASDVLGQYQDEDQQQPSFTQIGPNGGPSWKGFRFYPRKAGTAVFQQKFTDGLAIDPIGNRLFVPDCANHRLLVFALNADGTFPSRLAGNVLGQPDFYTTLPDSVAREDLNPAGPTATAASLFLPSAALFDPASQRLFIADTGNHRVLIYDLSAGITNGMAAQYVLGQSDFTSKQPNRGGALGSNGLKEPRGLFYDATRNNLWVADTGNNRLLVFDLNAGLSNGMPAQHVLGQNDFNSGLANRGGIPAANTFNRPKGLALSSDGKTLVVADVENNRVLAFDLTVGIQDGVGAVNILGQNNFSSVSPNQGSVQALPNSLYQPVAVQFDRSSHRLFVSDARNFRVLIYDFSGGLVNGQSATTGLGTQNLSHSVPDGLPPATASTMNYPTGITLAAERLFVVDVQNFRVLIFNAQVISNGQAALDVLGQFTEGNVNQPSFAQQGANDGPTSFELDQSDSVSGAAVDPVRHRLAICDAINGRVLIYTLDNSNHLNSRSASYVLGTPDFHTVGGNSTSEFTQRRPQRLVFDNQNRLFVADDQANRILVYDLSQGIVNGMAARYVIGQHDFISSASGVSPDKLARPRGVGYDPAHNWLFVADTNNRRVLVFNLAAGVANGMNASWVLGQNDFNSNGVNGGVALGASGMNNPRDPVYDTMSGLLYVADTGNRRILVFDLSRGVSNNLPATYVIGQTDFQTSAPGYAQNLIDGAGGIALDTQRRWLYISNQVGTRTLVFDLSRGVSTGMYAIGILGQKDFTSNDPLSTRRFASGSNLAVDSSTGTLYAVDPNNDEHHVLLFSPQFEFVKSLPSLIPNQSYETVIGAGGLGPLSFNIIQGSLPSGLTLNPTSGIITGIPNGSSAISFTVRVTDGLGQIRTAAFINAGTFILAESPNTVAGGGQLTVSWAVPGGRSSLDWIGLYKVGDLDSDYRWIQRTGGTSSGSLTAPAPSEAGQYEFRYFLSNTYNEIVRSNAATVTVTIPTPYTLTSSPGTVNTGGQLTINWTAPSGRPALDWIGLYKIGDPNTAYKWGQRTGGASSGGLTLTAPSEAGQYEFRYFLQNTYTEAARSSPVTVSGSGSSYNLVASPNTVAGGGQLTVSWTVPSGRSILDWVGLYKVGDSNSDYRWTQRTGGASSSSLAAAAPGEAGQYEFRYFLSNTYSEAARSSAVTVTVTTPTSYTLTASPGTLTSGSQITVSWTAPSGRPALDWIGFYKVGEPNSAYRWAQRTGGASSGSSTLAAPGDPGQYEFRYFLQNSYTLATRSNTVTRQ